MLINSFDFQFLLIFPWICWTFPIYVISSLLNLLYISPMPTLVFIAFQILFFFFFLCLPRASRSWPSCYAWSLLLRLYHPLSLQKTVLMKLHLQEHTFATWSRIYPASIIVPKTWNDSISKLSKNHYSRGLFLSSRIGVYVYEVFIFHKW